MWVPYQTGETFTPQAQVKRDVPSPQKSERMRAQTSMPTTSNSYYTAPTSVQKSKNNDKTVLNATLFTESTANSTVKQNYIADKNTAKQPVYIKGKAVQEIYDARQNASTSQEATNARDVNTTKNAAILHDSYTARHATVRHANPHAPQSGTEPRHASSSRYTNETDRTSLPVLTLQTIAFVGLYLCGCAIAGQIYPRLASAEQLYLAYYVNYYLSAASGGQVFALFCSNLLAALVSLSVVFLMGLSAFGVPLLFLFLLCKGLGCALILLQLFAQYQWSGVLYYLTLFGIIEAILVTCICLLSITAAKSAGSIFKYTIYTTNGAKKHNLKRFIKQYCLLILLMVVVCACTAAVAYFALPYLSLTAAVS